MTLTTRRRIMKNTIKKSKKLVEGWRYVYRTNWNGELIRIKMSGFKKDGEIRLSSGQLIKCLDDVD